MARMLCICKSQEYTSSILIRNPTRFSYYGYRSNIYKWRVREAIILFMTTAEKKQWAEILEAAMKGAPYSRVSELCSNGDPFSDVPYRPKKLMIFINPYGGKGNSVAAGLWEGVDRVKWILGKANKIYTKEVNWRPNTLWSKEHRCV